MLCKTLWSFCCFAIIMYRWFWKCGRLFSVCGRTFMGHFKEYFEGAKTFWTPKLSRAQRGTRLPTRSSAPVRIFLQELCGAPMEEDGAIGRTMSLPCVACYLPARSSDVWEVVTFWYTGAMFSPESMYITLESSASMSYPSLKRHKCIWRFGKAIGLHQLSSFLLS